METKDDTEQPQRVQMVRVQSAAIEPADLKELRELAKEAAMSKFFGAENPQQALMVMMAGKDLGFSYTQSLRAFYVVKGKPSLSADGMVAACLSHPEICEYFKQVSCDDKQATYTTKRVGNDPQTMTFTIEDAKLAGLAGSETWKKYPRRMLGARCRSFLARDVYPDLLMGLYDPDEIEQSSSKGAPVRQVAVQARQVIEADPEASATLAAGYEVDLREAKSKDDLKKIRLAIGEAVKSSKLTDADRAALSIVYEQIKKELDKGGRVAPEPGPSGPKVVEAEFVE